MDGQTDGQTDNSNTKQIKQTLNVATDQQTNFYRFSSFICLLSNKDLETTEQEEVAAIEKTSGDSTTRDKQSVAAMPAASTTFKPTYTIVFTG